MRDVVLTLVIFGTLPFILRRPHIGVLVWTWIGFMNPHRLSWGFAYSLPFAAIVAGATLIGLLVTKDPRKLPMMPAIGVLIAVDLLPDVFKTLANVTGHLAAVTLLARGER